MPLPEQAPPARPMAGYVVMSWHCAVIRDVCVPAPWSPPRHSPATLPAASAKIRGAFTMRASCGRASGTWMTSMRNSDVFGSSSGASAEQPGSSSPGRTGLVPEL
jgi:hypothetical protein